MMARRLVPAAALLLSLLTTACRHEQSAATAEPGFRFEPQPHQLPFPLVRPVVASAVNGDLYLLGVDRSQDGSKLTLTTSNDAGDRWGQPAVLNTAGTMVSTAAENAPQIAARGMYAYALWQQHDEAGATTLQFARTSPGMAHMPPHVVSPVDKPAGDTSYTGFASFTVAPNGDIYAVWLDGRSPASSPGTFSVYLARSTDKGMTFQPNVRVAELSCPCCRPAAAVAADGTVYVVYRHVYDDNERDIAMISSHDGGQHWSAPVRVSTDRWKLFGCPESGPVIAIQHNSPVVSWYTASEQKPGIRLATSSDGGKTFQSARRVSDGILSANHPYLSQREDGTIAVSFSGRAAGQTGEWSPLVPYLYSVSPGGSVTRASALPAVAAGGRYPAASLGQDGSVYLAWSTEDEQPKTFFSRATAH
ncbi:exo-alpha-sialidase [Terriglobus albidus]|uniref:Exo-alpha-sialidase n=1 Tax=Terriglobus albidus TaxID=1592106 RepID=A0A5B9EAD8_9BACT|nr:sialidase family protein [Terriglobus albidus]QEE28739.1 exo-alpha-sialidase [Terriglobus albidus]